jgi:hypothetical protein
VATRSAQAKKVAKTKKAAADHAEMALSRGKTTPVKKPAGATASSAGPGAGDEASTGATGAATTNADAESVVGRGPESERPVAPPELEKEPGTTDEGGSPTARLKERRTKAARDPARHDEPVAPTEEAPSTESVVHGDEVRDSRRPPLLTSSFTELHAALNDFHVVSVVCPPSPRGSTWAKGASRAFHSW